MLGCDAGAWVTRNRLCSFSHSDAAAPDNAKHKKPAFSNIMTGASHLRVPASAKVFLNHREPSANDQKGEIASIFIIHHPSLAMANAILQDIEMKRWMPIVAANAGPLLASLLLR